MQSENIILVISTSTSFSVLERVAVFLKLNGHRPVILFDNNYPTVHSDIASCKRQGIQYHCLVETTSLTEGPVMEPESTGKAIGNFRKSPVQMARKFLSRILTGSILSIIRTNQVAFRRFENVYREIGASLTIMAFDLVQYPTSLYIKATHRQGGKVILLLPFMSNFREPGEHYYDHPQHQISGVNAVFVKLFFGKWQRLYRGKRLLRLPLKEVLAKEITNAAPPDPWTANSGDADIIAVEGEAVKEYCIREGLNPEKIRVTGSIALDQLFECRQKQNELAAALRERYGLDPSKKILLSAVPPDMLSSRAAFSEFKTYIQLLNEWVHSLCSIQGYEVLLSFHPSVHASDYKSLEAEFPCRVVVEPIVNVLAACDLFVSSISSTIQWAIALSIPVVNYDVYRYEYDDYRGVEGVLYVQTISGFSECLKRFEDWSFLEKMRARQGVHAGRWGRLDGNSGKRLLQLI